MVQLTAYNGNVYICNTLFSPDHSTDRLPENPIDTEDDNALLRTDGLPEFDQLTPEKCWTGMGKLALEYESGVWAVEERAKGEEACVYLSSSLLRVQTNVMMECVQQIISAYIFCKIFL